MLPTPGDLWSGRTHLGLGALVGLLIGAGGLSVLRPMPPVTPVASVLPTRESVEAVERARQASYSAGEATASARTLVALSTPDNLGRALPDVAQAVLLATAVARTPTATVPPRPTRFADTTRVADATQASLPRYLVIPTTTETIHVTGPAATPGDPYPGPP